MERRILGALAGGLLLTAGAVQAQESTFSIKLMTPETALKLARNTLEACRKEGFQVAVAVVDRVGVLQVFLRDRYAGAHTVDIATNKAWTAASFRQSTLEFGRAIANPANSGPQYFPRAVVVGGGVPVETGGAILGAVGVSGGPGGVADDRCAQAGLESIRGDIEF